MSCSPETSIISGTNLQSINMPQGAANQHVICGAGNKALDLVSVFVNDAHTNGAFMVKKCELHVKKYQQMLNM